MDKIDNFKCRICKNSTDNLSYVAREMMFGLREEFQYFQCSHCGCLQIAEIPSDMSPYYPANNYYSYQSSAAKKTIKSALGLIIRKKVINYYLKRGNAALSWSMKTLLQNKEYKWITELPGLKLSSDILDIGSGTGSLLLELNKLGFKNLSGIDPFLTEDIHYECGINILKKEISDLDKQYDLVMLNHVFEHLDNPDEIFNTLCKLLKPDGFLLIRIPVADCFSWRKYGVCWFQLDAPRHFFLHTVRSMSILAKNNGVDVLSVEYDSNENQFYHSEKYTRDIPLFEEFQVKHKVLNNWKKHARWLNHIHDGDQACLIFQKTN